MHHVNCEVNKQDFQRAIRDSDSDYGTIDTTVIRQNGAGRNAQGGGDAVALLSSVQQLIFQIPPRWTSLAFASSFLVLEHVVNLYWGL